MRKRGLFALLELYSWCHVAVCILRLLLAVSLVCLQSVIVAWCHVAVCILCFLLAVSLVCLQSVIVAWCHVAVCILRLLLAVSLICLQSVIVAFTRHTQGILKSGLSKTDEVVFVIRTQNEKSIKPHPSDIGSCPF